LNILIGADPELFAYDKETGIPKSVHDILPGDKLHPIIVPRGAIQVDGVAAEFNINPTEDERTFMTNIKSVRRILDSILAAKDNKLELKAVPVAYFPKNYFESLPSYSKALGCEPDYSAYTKDVNPKPVTDEPFRTGSGHVHIGWTAGKERDKEHFEQCCEIVKELDFVLYNSSLLWDNDEKRRQLYGAPGAFRPKAYGLEYRVLSNAWLNERATQRFIFHASRAVTKSFFNGKRLSGLYNFNKFKFKDFCSFLRENGMPDVMTYYSRHKLRAALHE